MKSWVRIGPLLGQNGKEWIVPQGGVVVEVFVSQGNTEDPLAEQRSQVMGDLGWVARARDAIRQSRGQTESSIRLPQEQRPGVGGQPSAVEIGGDFLPSEPGKR